MRLNFSISSFPYPSVNKVLSIGLTVAALMTLSSGVHAG